MLTRVEQRKKDTRARIVKAAMDLFAKKGVEETTVAEISEVADIGKGTFFTYFPTKEDVFSDVGHLMFEMMFDGVEAKASEGSSVEEQLTHLLVPGIEWHAKHPKLSRLSFIMAMRAPAPLDRDDWVIASLEELLASVVKQGQALGEFRPEIDPDATANVLVGLYMISLQRWHSSGTKTSLVDIFRHGLEVVMRGLVK